MDIERRGDRAPARARTERYFRALCIAVKHPARGRCVPRRIVWLMVEYRMVVGSVHTPPAVLQAGRGTGRAANRNGGRTQGREHKRFGPAHRMPWFPLVRNKMRYRHCRDAPHIANTHSGEPHAYPTPDSAERESAALPPPRSRFLDAQYRHVAFVLVTYDPIRPALQSYATSTHTSPLDARIASSTASDI